MFSLLCLFVCLSVRPFVCLSTTGVWCIQVTAISKDWASRAALPQHVVQLVNNLPSSVHPMSQFSAAITAMNSESKFAKAYSEGISKTNYWEVRGREGGRERRREGGRGLPFFPVHHSVYL